LRGFFYRFTTYAMTLLSKETLRLEAQRHRDRIELLGQNEDPEHACALFFETIKPAPGQNVALYWPKGKEFDTGAIIERLLKEGIGCALPVMATDRDDKVLRFARWDESVALVEGPFKVMQPVVDEATKWITPDIIVVPLLAFDRRGQRLGYGGGYYDATLAALRAQKPDLIAAGVAYAQQAVLFNLPAEPHDQKLDWVITPQKVHRYID